MPGWLYGLPKICIVLLFGVIGAALFVGALFLRAKLWRFEGQTDQSKTARDALTVVIGFAGLMLASFSEPAFSLGGAMAPGCREVVESAPPSEFHARTFRRAQTVIEDVSAEAG